jgi:hypothetical protein
MMAEGMRWLKLPVVVTALLCVLVNAQCVLRCTSTPCAPPAPQEANLPPCHRHAPRTPASKPCISPVILVDGRLHASPPSGAPVIDGVIGAVELPPPTVWIRAGVTHRPPLIDSSGPALFVLRV